MDRATRLNSDQKKAKKYLNQLYWQGKKINDKLEEVAELRDLVNKIVPSQGGESVQTTKDNDKLGSTIAKIVDLENEINEEINTLINLKREIKMKIREVTKEELREVLTSRYIMRKKWEQIAIDMNYTYQHLCGPLHRDALSEVGRKIKNM